MSWHADAVPLEMHAPIKLKAVLILSPSTIAAPVTAVATMARIRAYSAAEAPSVSLINLSTRTMILPGPAQEKA